MRLSMSGGSCSCSLVQVVIAEQHESLLEMFESSYEPASEKTTEAYEWLNHAMADYQKETMQRCSPELTPGMIY